MKKQFIFQFAEEKTYQESMVCPKCQDEFSYLHFSKPVLINGYDKYSANYCGWSGRGSLIIIPFYCENCNNMEEHGFLWRIGSMPFALCLGFHKGQSQLWWFIPEDINKDWFPINNEWNERY